MPDSKALCETPENAKNCLERILKALGKKYNKDVASEFVEAVGSISRKELMSRKELAPYIEKYVEIFERYILKK